MFLDKVAKNVAYNCGRFGGESVIEQFGKQGWSADLSQDIRKFVGDHAASPGYMSRVKSAMDLLNSMDKGAVLRQYGRTGKMPEGTDLAIQFMNKFGYNMSKETQFFDGAENLPITWAKPMMSVAVQFKSFAFMQGKMWKDAMEYQKIRGKSPLWRALKTLAVANLFGEGIWDARLALSGRWEELQKRLDFDTPWFGRLVWNFLSAGGVGLFADALSQGVRSPTYVTWASMITGPTMSDIFKFMSALSGVDVRSGVKIIPWYNVLGGVLNMDEWLKENMSFTD